MKINDNILVNRACDLIDYFHRTYFNNYDFISNDPISVPHKFSRKEDIEVAGFLSSAIAWGNRKAIIKSCNDMMNRMDNAPYDFIINAQENDLKAINNFYYRTFQETDLACFIDALKNIYVNHGGLENVFMEGYDSVDFDKIKNAIIHFRNVFFEKEYPARVSKHVANPQKGSAAKRINMFLRWMVRKDENNIDFGLWNKISTADLIIPLDVHVGNTARNLRIINSTANNWKTAEELTNFLRQICPEDPVKFDFALFGISNSKISFANIDK